MSRIPAGRANLRLVQWFWIAIGLVVVVAVAGAVAGLLALGRLSENRRLVADQVDPAITSAYRLSTALLNEETGVRGFALSGEAPFLEPFARGRREEAAATADLRRRVPAISARLEDDLVAVQRASADWRGSFATPVIRDVRAGRRTFTRADQARGRMLFDRTRRAVAALQADLQADRRTARQGLTSAATTVSAIFIGFGVLLLIAVLVAALVLRGVVVRPIARLAERVREVARGDFQRHVEADGARDVVDLGADVDAMRVRILHELDALAAARDDLERSNAELEQFAYVASHDLQEPLRKVASFTQMLARRYQGQLDERADQYIAFAVDGAKRMQDLINDLLAFSRVGRVTEGEVVVDCNVLVERALASLQPRIEETGATVEVGELPQVRGEPGLLELVFQNLIGNGLKFRGPEPPLIRVAAERAGGEDGDEWCFTVADNGIGIEPEYADRIFIIFQRLHPRTSYEGTGIGLAMCRKVIEYHGGRIWLNTEAERGAEFHFTLPVIPDEPQEVPEP